MIFFDDVRTTNDFVAQDIRHSLHHLGKIRGEISTGALLENIFRKFCMKVDFVKP